MSFLLSGCAIWPFSFFPSWGWLAADGASYITTGKLVVKNTHENSFMALYDS